MTKKDLIEKLEPYSDDVKIYIESDHGQVPESAGAIVVSKDEEFPDMDFDGDLSWKDADTVKNKSHVTAIKIY